ncbi:MAG: hypothetical protein D4R97_06295 [Bacteroidetes bacterium]|nr:MAG: hypothetical protein D4R97_06295 [Bacteroidota bacterium]
MTLLSGLKASGLVGSTPDISSQHASQIYPPLDDTRHLKTEFDTDIDIAIKRYRIKIKALIK